MFHSDEKSHVSATDENLIDLSENEKSLLNEDISSQEMKNEEQYLFSPETISSVLGIDLPKDIFFRFDLPDQCTYRFPADIWQSLCKSKKDRCFKRNSWQDHFLEGLKESNPHSVFTFIVSQMHSKDKRKFQLPFFMLRAHVNLKVVV